jgi:hypothetical protein
MAPTPALTNINFGTFHVNAFDKKHTAGSDVLKF